MDYFKTSDIALCATLQCFGYAVETIDRSDPERVAFLIRRDGHLDELIQDFFTHKLKVNPNALLHNLKEIKTRIYSTSNANR